MTRAALLEELEELKRTGRAAARAVMGARRAMRANILAICERCTGENDQVDLKAEVASV
jgi:hypothetical protein